MENFFYDDMFCTDLGDLMDRLDINEECTSIDDDWSIQCRESSLEPVVQISADWILERIDEERWSEDAPEHDKVYKLLKQIDFTLVNEKIPKLYYPTGAKFTITKKDLLEYCI